MEIDEIQRCMRDSDYLIRKYYESKKNCMAESKSECNQNICQAHTISKKFLNNLSENGHIYYPCYSSYNTSGLYEFQLKGVNNATTFLGFCTFHDNELFQSFEKTNFDPENASQIRDLTFRALAREFFKKKCQLDFSEGVIKGYFNDISLTNYIESSDFKIYLRQVTKEAREHRYLYEQLKRKANLKYIIFKFNKLPIATTGVIFPCEDFFKTPLQDGRRRMHGFVCSVLPDEKFTYVIIATVKSLNNNVDKIFLESILKECESLVVNLLFSYFFYNNEVIAIQRSWFDLLDTQFKGSLSNLLNCHVGHYGQPCFFEVLDFKSHMKSNVLKKVLNL